MILEIIVGLAIGFAFGHILVFISNRKMPVEDIKESPHPTYPTGIIQYEDNTFGEEIYRTAKARNNRLKEARM